MSNGMHDKSYDNDRVFTSSLCIITVQDLSPYLQVPTGKKYTFSLKEANKKLTFSYIIII